MDSLWQDFRYALRMLTKDPVFSAVAVLVLALGIGANAATFTLTNSLLLRPIEAESPSELVALYSKDTQRPDSYRSFSYPNFEDIRALNKTFSEVLAHDLTTVGVTEGDATRRVFAEFASHDYFDTYGVSPFRGRFFSAAEEEPGSGIPVVVVSYERWRQAGSDPDFVGSTLTVNGQPLTVVGIAPRFFTGRTALMSPGLYLPFGMHHLLLNDMFGEGDGLLGERDNHRLFLVGRLLPGLTMEEADAQLATLAAQMEETYPAINENQTIIVGPLSRLSISTSPPDEVGLGLVAVMMLAMTGIVLLIACINLANMMLARGAARRREFAIRAAIGGGRSRIMRQLLTEGLMLSALGGLAGLVMAYWVNNLLGASINRLLVMSGIGVDIILRTTPDASVLLVTAAFCIFGTLLFGFGPAWKQSRPDVMGDLKRETGDGAGKGRRQGPFAQRNVLIISQVALSMVLLVSAGLFIRGSLEAAAVDPGFNLDDGILVEVDPSLVGYDEPRSRELYRVLHERLVGIPAIESAAVAATVPFGAISNGESVRRAEDLPGVGADGTDVIETVSATANVVGADYFETLGVPLMRGRAFTRQETESGSGPKVAIVDELLAAELWPDEDPVGRQIGFGREREGDDLEVVGVVATVRDDLLPAELRPHVYVPFGQNFQAGMNIHLRTAPLDDDGRDALLQSVRAEIRAVDGRLPIMKFGTMQDHIRGSAALWMVRLGASIFTAFGALALFLAVIGVYGVKAYTVAQRTREIGIRKALGATASDTLWLVVREGAVLTGVGLGLGVVLSAGVAQLLSGLLYEVSALDPISFVVAPAVLAAASFLATYVPARRAARVAPIAALRHE
jgi:predicted permease